MHVSHPTLINKSESILFCVQEGAGRPRRREAKYLFYGLRIELRTFVWRLRKLSPAREQAKQTMARHAVWRAADPRVCLFAQTVAMTDGGAVKRERFE